MGSGRKSSQKRLVPLLPSKQGVEYPVEFSVNKPGTARSKGKAVLCFRVRQTGLGQLQEGRSCILPVCTAGSQMCQGSGCHCDWQVKDGPVSMLKDERRGEHNEVIAQRTAAKAAGERSVDDQTAAVLLQKYVGARRQRTQMWLTHVQHGTVR